MAYPDTNINFLSYQQAMTIPGNSGPISKDGSIMSSQLKTSR